MKHESILIVEDEQIITIDLQKRLEKFGYTVAGLAASGDEAVKKAGDLMPDLVLMDIMLTDETDGIEAAKAIKELYQIPVIFLTAYSDEKTINLAKTAEPFGYILKPFNDKELHTTIDIALYKYKTDVNLIKERRWLAAILHSIQDGIIATDMDNHIRIINPAAERITGWKFENAVNQNLEDILKLTDAYTKLPVTLPSTLPTEENKLPFVFKNLVLKNRNSDYINIDGTLALISDKNGNSEGRIIALHDRTKVQSMSDTISYQASHDSLTGLINRIEFSKKLSDIIDKAKTDNSRHILIFLDLDKFKVINDTCGHSAGDELLIETASIIKKVIRNSDSCARLGGDEFGILLENSTQDQALSITSRLHARLNEKKMTWENGSFPINSSIGFVIVDKNSLDLYSVLAAADEACYLAKDQGGNRIIIYDTSRDLFQQRRGEMHWISPITRALEENRFRLYYQKILPLDKKVNLKSKCEILIRMVDTDNNIIMPADFIPAAERYNLMPLIDKWVISTTLKYYKEFMIETQSENIEIICINLSAPSLADETFLDFIINEFKTSKVPLKKFCFEITETAAINNISFADKFITELKKSECTFALDDFGSGFSSFNYLKNLPVDYLKIDGIFVQDMHENSVNRAMVKAINNLGHIMGIKTIAEFVKNKQIKKELELIGVDYAQGYEISKPKPILPDKDI